MLATFILFCILLWFWLHHFRNVWPKGVPLLESFVCGLALFQILFSLLFWIPQTQTDYHRVNHVIAPSTEILFSLSETASQHIGGMIFVGILLWLATTFLLYRLRRNPDTNINANFLSIYLNTGYSVIYLSILIVLFSPSI